MLSTPRVDLPSQNSTPPELTRTAQVYPINPCRDSGLTWDSLRVGGIELWGCIEYTPPPPAHILHPTPIHIHTHHSRTDAYLPYMFSHGRLNTVHRSIKQDRENDGTVRWEHNTVQCPPFFSWTEFPPFRSLSRCTKLGRYPAINLSSLPAGGSHFPRRNDTGRLGYATIGTEETGGRALHDDTHPGRGGR